MKNILFIRLRLLGDIILTIPTLEIYKKNFPQSNIYYVVEEKFREIAELLPGVHQVIPVPTKMSIKEHFRFRKQMNSLALDAVVDFHSGPKSALLTRISGTKMRIGYKTPNRNWAYTHLTSRKLDASSPTHSTFNQAKLLEHLGITVTETTIPLYPPIANVENNVTHDIKNLLENETGNFKKVVIHVGAGNSFRDWGIENFSKLIERLVADQVMVFLVGHSEEEKKKGAYLTAQQEPKGPQKRKWVYDLTGRLSIADMFFLISQVNVYFGVDSGPLHLASLTQTPLVALYGPNIPEISGPWRKKDVDIIQLSLACRPCAQRKCIYDTIQCMKNIKTDVVYEAI
ncbi:MAG TPA: glycosyltransferase family 9 protein, partial [Candidatus Deferrimicrobium sp.]|nr:glycosyltransferase family 9 protein [Candidatus Deferrimicrobium sp.]